MRLHLPTTALIRYTKTAVAGLMLVGLIGVGWFLYRNFYEPITQAVVVAELKQHIALVTVERAALDDLRRAIDERQRVPLVDWNAVRDIFRPDRPAERPGAEPARPATAAPERR